MTFADVPDKTIQYTNKNQKERTNDVLTERY